MRHSQIWKFPRSTVSSSKNRATYGATCWFCTGFFLCLFAFFVMKPCQIAFLPYFTLIILNTPVFSSVPSNNTRWNYSVESWSPLKLLLTVGLDDGMTYSSGLTQTHQTVVGAVDFWSALMKSWHGNDSHVASVHTELSDKQGHETASAMWFLVFKHEHCVFLSSELTVFDRFSLGAGNVYSLNNNAGLMCYWINMATNPNTACVVFLLNVWIETLCWLTRVKWPNAHLSGKVTSFNSPEWSGVIWSGSCSSSASWSHDEIIFNLWPDLRLSWLDNRSAADCWHSSA